MSGLEKKFATKSKIVNYIINRESTSKVEISKELNLSMPTVLSNVKDLLEKGIIILENMNPQEEERLKVLESIHPIVMQWEL